MNTDPAQFVVEVSNPRSGRDERFVCGGVKGLADCLEDQGGHSRADAEDNAEYVAAGNRFEREDEDGNVVTAARVGEAVPA